MLDKLTNEQLIRIIQWTLNDLNAWNNNKNGVLPEVKRFTGMFEEAVKYQVTKAINSSQLDEELSDNDEAFFNESQL
jgi:hypothetical protein